MDELLRERLGEELPAQTTRDKIPTVWIPAPRIRDVLRHLKYEIRHPFKMLYDLTAIDERERTHREGQPAADFTIVYLLYSFDRNAFVRIKVALQGDVPHIDSAVPVWPMAGWYECEVWDMFGVRFDDHPHLRRILLPPTWVGHPLRKEHPARGTEMGPYELPSDKVDREQEALRFRPEDWGMERRSEDTDFM
ncbi:MAG: NADH-quinone oxidoreductase subunit C/D, partial [Candidatus Eisenbacteria bacterium]|nr:NADH-quinone oxidoreductase subunit C/D [Candidatus Eisenbacteria bacterium]